MNVLLKIAIRNILRNRKRSLITLSAVTFGLGALVFLRGFVFGAQSQMIKNITTGLTSDAQILPKSLENIYNTNGAIEDPESIRKIINSDERILGYAERVLGGGIVSSATTSMATFVVGFDPDQETKIGSRRSLALGRLMTQEDLHTASMGEPMRQILGLNIGDKFVVTAQDYYGALTGEAFTLVGTFETGNDQIDNGTVMLILPASQRLLSFDHRISKFGLHIDEKYSVQEVVGDLKKKMAASEIQDKDLKVVTWEDLIPMLAQMLRFQNGMIFVVVLIVLTVVSAGILNTLMMSIIERIREFGLMLALGTEPRQVVWLVMMESLILTTIGAFVGVLIGITLTLYFGHVGIDLSNFMSTLKNFLIGSHVYPRIDWKFILVSVAVVLFSNLFVSLFPAWRAGKLAPIEAMRQVG